MAIVLAQFDTRAVLWLADVKVDDVKGVSLALLEKSIAEESGIASWEDCAVNKWLRVGLLLLPLN